MRYTIIALLFVMLNSACVQQAAPPETDTLPKTVRSIAVLPAGVMIESGVKPSPQTLKALEMGVVALEQTVAEALSANPKVRLLSADEVEVHAKSYSASPLAQALAVGKALRAEAVMLWGLARYQERSGGDYGAQTPASVSFQYRLIHTESGQTLCAASFEETQQSATDNLLAINTLAKRGFKWVPAAVLLQEGVSKKLADCEYLQVSEGQTEDALPVALDSSKDSLSSDTRQPDAKSSVAPDIIEPDARAEALSPPMPAAAPSPQQAAPPSAGHALDARYEAVSRFLDDWRKAWEASAGPQGDIARYGAFYTADFTSANQGRTPWLADKARKNRGKEWIRVRLSDLKITGTTDSPLLEVRFTQEYSSSNYAETSQKSLVLRPNGTRWEIVAER